MLVHTLFLFPHTLPFSLSLSLSLSSFLSFYDIHMYVSCIDGFLVSLEFRVDWFASSTFFFFFFKFRYYRTDTCNRTRK